MVWDKSDPRWELIKGALQLARLVVTLLLVMYGTTHGVKELEGIHHGIDWTDLFGLLSAGSLAHQGVQLSKRNS